MSKRRYVNITNIDPNKLRKRVLRHIESQGFKINPHIKPKNDTKETYRNVHKLKKQEKLLQHKKFLLENSNLVQDCSINGRDIDPRKIDLSLIEVKSDTDYAKLFFWWNLVWWSLPHQTPIGRSMRFLLWDNYHNAPFGLFCLQSPSIKMKVRDDYLQLEQEDVGYWINMSMYGQRIGALPPYNELIGSKMVALSTVSNEVRKLYGKKYKGKRTLIRDRVIPSELLFVTTTSAFGKSSVYDRISYNGENISEFVGYTAGSGTFHLSEELYLDLLKLLEDEGIDTKRGYGTGASRKLRLVSNGLRLLGISKFEFHNIQRGVYFFSLVKNLEKVIHENKRAIYYDRPFGDLADFWIDRWCVPRSERTSNWKAFNSKKFLDKQNELIRTL